jgi:hypothetical protein
MYNLFTIDRRRSNKKRLVLNIQNISLTRNAVILLSALQKDTAILFDLMRSAAGLKPVHRDIVKGIH